MSDATVEVREGAGRAAEAVVEPEAGAVGEQFGGDPGAHASASCERRAVVIERPHSTRVESSTTTGSQWPGLPRAKAAISTVDLHAMTSLATTRSRGIDHRAPARVRLLGVSPRNCTLVARRAGSQVVAARTAAGEGEGGFVVPPVRGCRRPRSGRALSPRAAAGGRLRRARSIAEWGHRCALRGP
jgi:hypothetical protein